MRARRKGPPKSCAKSSEKVKTTICSFGFCRIDDLCGSSAVVGILLKAMQKEKKKKVMSWVLDQILTFFICFIALERKAAEAAGGGKK